VVIPRSEADETRVPVVEAAGEAEGLEAGHRVEEDAAEGVVFLGGAPVAGRRDRARRSRVGLRAPGSLLVRARACRPTLDSMRKPPRATAARAARGREPRRGLKSYMRMFAGHLKLTVRPR